MLQHGFVDKVGTGPENLLVTLKKLTTLVDDAHAYVSSVVVRVPIMSPG